MSSSPAILDPVVIPLIQGPRILDVGCGLGKWGYLCLTNYWETYGAQQGTIPEITGIDAFLPNVMRLREQNVYREVLHALCPPLPFGDQTFNTVLLIEVIEHLEKNAAFHLISEAQRVAQHRVVLSTPNFPSFRPGHETLTGFNPLEAHVSYWERRTLKKFGFKLYGAGLKQGHRQWRRILYRLGLLHFYDCQFRRPLGNLSYWFPSIAENVVGVWIKDSALHLSPPSREELASCSNPSGRHLFHRPSPTARIQE